MNVVSWKPEGSCEFRRVTGEMDGEWEDSVELNEECDVVRALRGETIQRTLSTCILALQGAESRNQT